MTDLDLTRLREIAEAATPGPSVEWREVDGSPGYLISDDGRVWSERSGRLLKPKPHPSGHLYVQLGRKRTAQVHRLVLIAFVGAAPEGHESLHRNGDPTDNRLSNLQWGTRSQNLLDAARHGTHYNAKKTHCPRGHEYTPENTRQSPPGRPAHRTCIACQRARQRRTA